MAWNIRSMPFCTEKAKTTELPCAHRHILKEDACVNK